MDEDNKVVAEQRETFGKGAARKIRAVGKIPAVLYGHGTDPQHLTLPAHQVGLLIRKANAVLDLQISGKSQIALVKDVQKDPVHQVIEHIDLIVIKRGEKVQVEVPVHVEGEPFAGTIADLDAHTLLLEVEATHIPERVVVSVEGKTWAIIWGRSLEFWPKRWLNSPRRPPATLAMMPSSASRPCSSTLRSLTISVRRSRPVCDRP